MTESAPACLLDFTIRKIAVVVSGKRLGVRPVLCEAVHLPWLAE
jgi:hypothetical protein